ncbi:MAG: PhoH family protein [Firmicutes bacterium]|nr:PhoH family protein [Bacillota bacterium]HOB34126.1 PhoH family protein [Bacillota bacterium]HPZ90624.1 PhoH family protein [Bacillota bacterium]HQE02242.1 PhoH family protein [Bacillota bacterium]
MTDSCLITLSNGEAVKLLGAQDRHLNLFNDLGVNLVQTDDGLLITGNSPHKEHVYAVIRHLLSVIRAGHTPSQEEIQYLLANYSESRPEFKTLYREEILITPRGKKIFAKTAGQQRYLQAIRNNDLVFGIGPAGTGKTYLAVAMAVRALKDKQIAKIILTRPAIEAGERLGFLPGDLQDKVDPYLRPLYDALMEFLGVDSYQKYMEKGIIEVAPLAYMRGRTLNDAFIILDEAQNTTPEQMKMFLTRFGFGSKAIVTGDITQIDLPRETVSGLRQVLQILRGIKGIEVITLDETDIIRHRLVADIVRAYAEHAKRRK